MISCYFYVLYDEVMTNLWRFYDDLWNYDFIFENRAPDCQWVLKVKMAAF